MVRGLIVSAALLGVMACGITERRVHERAAGGRAESAVDMAGAAGDAGSGGRFGAPGPGGGVPGSGGTTQGGMPVGGMPPVDACPVPAVEPSCEPMAGGAPSDWCAGASEAQAAGDTGTSKRLLIDDFEDGDDASFAVLEGRGGWFVVNDGSGQQYPMPCALPSPLEEPSRSSERALRTFGRGFSSMPGGYSQVGLALRSGAPACDRSVDASAFDGVEFWARGSGPVRFFIATVATNPVAEDGSCTNGCYDAHGDYVVLHGEWQHFRLPFVALSQEGWGYSAAFDPSQILALEWSAKTPPGTPSACFDFWIDDVAFYGD